MTAPIDPRIEAVAKLLFTGPIFQGHADTWEQAKAERWGPAAESLLAAEDVLRGIDEAAGWEYGVRMTDEVYPYWKEADARSWVREYSGQAMRRRPAGEWEPLP